MPALLVLACSAAEPGSEVVLTREAQPTAEASTPQPAAATATIISTAVISLTPQAAAPSAADLTNARRLESEGEIKAAAEAYIAAAASVSGAARAEPLLNAARLLLENEQPADVRALLEPFVASSQPPADLAAARYLLARAYTALSLWAQALAQYDAYIQAAQPALAYAHLDRARVLLSLEQPGQAVAAAQAGLNLGVPAAARRSFVLFIAQSNERAGNLAEALRGYQALFDTSGSAGDQALALARMAAIKRRQGDLAGSIADVGRLLAGYPRSSEALDELKAALGRGEIVDPSVRGLVYYRHNDYQSAEPAFLDQISLAPRSSASAEASYYLGAIAESRGENETARQHYSRAAILNPASLIADDALWWSARILEDENRLDEAQVLFNRIVSEYPQSSWAADAAFRRGLLPYRSRRYLEAGAAWGQALAFVQDPAERQRLSLWQAKSLLRGSQAAAARPILNELAAVNEDDYAGVRAQSLLKGKHEQPKAVRDSNTDLTPRFDWQAAEGWLSARTGVAVAEAGWPADQRWARALELWRGGRNVEGDTEAFDLIEAYARDSTAMYTMARRLQSLGRIGLSARAGQRLLRTLNANPRDGLPKPLLSLSYPPAFGPAVKRYAEAERVSPLLLLAFIRQESFFDPRAESPAGALGLTQVLPSTARALGQRLGIADVGRDRLLTVELNLRLGASYMAEQLRDFGDEIFVAFAAYNAGPNAARRWRRAAGEDADLFLETVEFRESRLYVEIVAENYAIYRYLYANEPYPSLPD